MHGFKKSPSALFYKQTLSLEIRKSEGSPHKSISISQLTHVYGRILLISIFLRNFIQQQHLRILRPITKKCISQSTRLHIVLLFDLQFRPKLMASSRVQRVMRYLNSSGEWKILTSRLRASAQRRIWHKSRV